MQKDIFLKMSPLACYFENFLQVQSAICAVIHDKYFCSNHQSVNFPVF